MTQPSTTQTSTTAPAGLARPAWLLIATLPVFVAYLALAIATFADRAATTADFTRGDIDDLGLAWMAVHLLWITPPVLAAIALTILARRLGGPPARIVPVLAVVTAVAAAVYLVINVLAYTTDAPTWGESSLYPWSNITSILTGWLGVHPATLIIVVALVRAGVARRTSIVVGVVYALYVVFELLVYLPVIFGSETFAEMTGGLPPFLLGIFWAVLGSGLLRARVPSAP